METYTIQEVSKILKLSQQTIVRMINRGEIKAKKFAHRWRIPKEEIDTKENDQL